MDNKTLRRPYAAPSAEIICLAPGEAIAASWKWDKERDPGNWNSNKWGFDIFSQTISATGFAQWLDDATETENPELK